MHTLAKSELRRHFLQHRRNLSPDRWQLLGDGVCNTLQRMAIFQAAQTVLAYRSIRQEPDLSALWSVPKNWGLPRCEGRGLAWHRWQRGDCLVAGAYGVLEPSPQAERLHPTSVDLLLVPALACDRQGYRLGYGGGYYDRLLSLPDWQGIPTLGIVFDFAFVTELPRDDWDRPLTGVCTERQGILFG